MSGENTASGKYYLYVTEVLNPKWSEIIGNQVDLYLQKFYSFITCHEIQLDDALLTYFATTKSSKNNYKASKV